MSLKSRFLILQLLNIDFDKTDLRFLEKTNVLELLSPMINFTGGNQAISGDVKSIQGEKK